MNKVRCARCGDIFTTADLDELREMGETYYLEKKLFSLSGLLGYVSANVPRRTGASHHSEHRKN